MNMQKSCGDGINDANEVTNGTHPYLKDSDFDGYLDDNDIEPLKYNAGSGKEVDYTEDRVVGLFDKVKTWIDENGNVYQYIYNFINDNVEYTMINGVIAKYYYNANNQLMAVLTMNGDVMDAVTYTYNGDATAIYYNGGLVFECEYDENGQVVKVADYVAGYEQFYTYKEDGNIDTITSDNYNIAYEYNDEEYVINYDVNGNEFVQVIYNDTEDKYVSQYSSLLISGGLHENIETEEDVVEYKITKDGNVVFSNLLTYDGSTVTNISYNNGDELAYEYTKEGNISSVLQNGDKVIEYYYDNLGRVVREDNALAGKSYEFIYNEDNNMSLKREYSYSTDELTELLKEESFSYENPWKDQVTSIDGDAITYDEVGNPISYRDGMNFEWNGKTLSGVNGIADIEFTYNNEGIRTSKTVDGAKTEYVIEGKDIVFEISDNGTIAYIYDSDMNVIGMICDEETYYYEKNVQSDVVRILDEEGNIRCEYVYDAWGNVVLIEGDTELARKNPFRYRSYYYDVETGLYYAESRYYDPETGRFINADKIEAIVWDYTNLNMYVYCGNDPVNYYDPSGEAAIWLKTFISRDIFEDKSYYSTQLIYTNSSWVSDLDDGGSHIRYTIDDADEFEELWESITYMDVLIIMAHGTPTTLQFGKIDENLKDDQDEQDLHYLTVDEISNFKDRKIKLIWLISCNAGHYDHRNSNIAWALSKKISGVVVGADGTVVADKNSSNHFVAYIHASADWYNNILASRDSAYGWVLYKNDKYVLSLFGTVKYTKKALGKNIFQISEELEKKGYVSYK